MGGVAEDGQGHKWVEFLKVGGITSSWDHLVVGSGRVEG